MRWDHLPHALVFMVFIALMFTALGTVVPHLLKISGFKLIINLIMPMFTCCRGVVSIDGRSRLI